MEARDPELRKELNATLDARRELGEDYDSALVDSFLEKVEQRLDGTVDRRMRRHLAEQQMVVARGSRSPQTTDGWGERYGFGMVSLILAIPLSAIGAVNADLSGLLVTWAGILGVNIAHAAHGAPWARRARRPKESGQDSPWEE
ncbi:hypothetical protein [Streptomyces tsukubensis]|uniref:Integral membrane protein n=1 Tax=Streptomyces tsukubensis TaxID=83656 RepID=A0A1V4A2D5_9ACTN|nr:hypothetical protein [Streptomyces tsukubensis]OON73010.1 hypothetical protein B1H18_28040 [Streptomyces tsukubensis]QFR93993.1 hypothetical protein GBW32_14140 [Streptomyces tsukubensis]